MDSKLKRASVVNRIGPPVALWIVNKLLTQPRVASATSRLDREVEARKRRAKSALRTATRNASANSGLLTAGLAAIGVGIGLLARAAKRR